MLLPALPPGGEPDPPPGLLLRDFVPGDRGLWDEIQQSTGIYDPFPPDLFEREFGSDPACTPSPSCSPSHRARRWA